MLTYAERAAAHAAAKAEAAERDRLSPVLYGFEYATPKFRDGDRVRIVGAPSDAPSFFIAGAYTYRDRLKGDFVYTLRTFGELHPSSMQRIRESNLRKAMR